MLKLDRFSYSQKIWLKWDPPVFGVEIFFCYSQYFIKSDFIIGGVECMVVWILKKINNTCNTAEYPTTYIERNPHVIIGKPPVRKVNCLFYPFSSHNHQNKIHTGGSCLSQIFWEHENLSGLSVIWLIYIKLWGKGKKIGKKSVSSGNPA